MLQVLLQRDGHTAEEVYVYTIEEASATVTAFQQKYGMGASDMGSAHGKVYVGNTMVYTVSYNGRVWARSDADKTLFNKLIHDPGK
jgi:hypothetical protein